jgi:anti-sigma B factor antagonist
MDVSVEHIGGVDLVVLNDTTLDAVNSVDFREAVAPLVSGGARVVLDISRLTFVDSSGLGAILTCRRLLKASGGDLRLLCGIAKPVRLFFELARINGIIEIHDTREEALSGFGAATVPR